MISIRQLLVIALLMAGLWLLGRLRQRLISRRQANKPSIKKYEEMVRCAHCGIHTPRQRAVGSAEDGYYCSMAHRLAKQSRQT